MSGCPNEDPTIAELLKPLGYATGQFGRTTSVTSTSTCRPNHGFDEFFGNLYHLNAEEEPELPDYPEPRSTRCSRAPPRGVLHCWATDNDTGEVDPEYGPLGKQRIEDTGPLTKKRMETIDDETTSAAIDFIRASTRPTRRSSCG